MRSQGSQGFEIACGEAGRFDGSQIPSTALDPDDLTLATEDIGHRSFGRGIASTMQNQRVVRTQGTGDVHNGLQRWMRLAHLGAPLMNEAVYLLLPPAILIGPWQTAPSIRPTHAGSKSLVSDNSSCRVDWPTP